MLAEVSHPQDEDTAVLQSFGGLHGSPHEGGNLHYRHCMNHDISPLICGGSIVTIDF
jgi:hypothetical protein